MQSIMYLSCQTTLVRNYNNLQNVPVGEMSLHFIGLLFIYHHFKFEDTSILALNALDGYMSKKNVTSI
jgi:hypothetical protein